MPGYDLVKRITSTIMHAEKLTIYKYIKSNQYLSNHGNKDETICQCNIIKLY